MEFEIPDPKRLRTNSLSKRKNLFSRESLVLPTAPPGDVLAGFPDLLGGAALKELCRTVADAARRRKCVVMAMGAHVIKCGLSLLVIDMMERGILSAVALNGAGAIHDFELAAAGGTSEDVRAELEDGSFGMAEETAAALNEAAREAARVKKGFGALLGARIAASGFPMERASILAAGDRLGSPVTVPVSLGGDIVQRPGGGGGMPLI